jgi:hypothetical protein
MARKVSFSEAIKKRADAERRKAAPSRAPVSQDVVGEIRYLDVGSTVPSTPAGPPMRRR